MRKALYLTVKRLLDLMIAGCGLILLTPLLLLIAVVIKLDSRGPVFYLGVRTGKHGSPFRIIKFRTMVPNADKIGSTATARHDPRITRVGNFLRRYKLDELPQLINILRGEMSLVGPRPERPYFVKMLEEQLPFYAERHSARPGLTGWAQINQPYGSSVEDAMRKLEYDLFYLKNVSLLFDYAILFDTVRIVFQGRGGR